MQRTIQTNESVISWLTISEVGSVLSRRVRNQEITVEQLQLNWRLFTLDLESFTLIPLTQAAMRGAAAIAARSPVSVRALDAIQLQGTFGATALLQTRGEPAPLLMSADQRLHLAAQALGLAIEDP